MLVVKRNMSATGNSARIRLLAGEASETFAILEMAI